MFRLEISLVYPLLECDFLGDVKKNIQEQIQENPKPPWTPPPPLKDFLNSPPYFSTPPTVVQ